MKIATPNDSDKIRILYIDDDSAQIEITRLSIHDIDSSIDVESTTSPSDALEMIKTGNYECLVSDYVMSGTNGIQLCKEMKKFSKIPFIIYTGQGSEEIAEQAFEAGVNGYIRKEKGLGHYRVLAHRIREAVEKYRIEELYKTIAEENMDAIVIQQGTIIKYANKAAVNLFGVVSSDELIGRNSLDWVASEDKERLQNFAALRQQGESQPRLYDFNLAHNEGSKKIEVLANRISYLGRPASLVLLRDVTKERKTESKLKLSEEQYDALFSNMTDALAYHKIICENDKPIDYVFLQLNDEFEKQTGLKREDILGKRVKQVIPEIEEDCTDWIGIYGKVAKEGNSVRFESYSKPLNRWYSVYAYSPQRDYFAVIFEDITNRKLMENRIEEERNVLEAIMEHSSALQAYFDKDFNFVVVNPQYVKSSGHTLEELIGRNHFELFPNKENEEIFRYVRDTGKAVKFFDKPFEYVDQPERGVTYWNWTLAPVKTKADEIQGFVLSLMETTERKKSEDKVRNLNEKLIATNNELSMSNEELAAVEEELRTANEELIAQHEYLRESEEKYRLLFESMSQGVSFYDENLRRISTNPAAERILGVPKSTLEDRLVENPTNVAVGEDGHELKHDEFPIVRAAKTGKKVENAIVGVYNQIDGKLHWVKNYVMPINPESKKSPYRYYAIFDDITEQKNTEEELKNANRKILEYNRALEEMVEERTKELKESEERLRSFMDSATDHFVIFNDELKITDLNNAALSIFPGNNKQYFIGKNITELFPELVKSERLLGYKNVIENGKPYNTGPYLKHLQGKDQWYESVAFKVGSGIGLRVTNITERKKLEEQLHISQQMSTISKIGATVAHDLRSPLSMIVQSLEMADRYPDRSARMLTIAKESANQALNMIEEFRVGTREVVAVKQLINISSLIKKAIERMMLPDNITLEIYIEDNIKNVKLDPDVILRVIDNLIRNAVEAMPYGGNLSISIINENNMTLVEISDTGIGIDEKALKQIWEPLFTTKSNGMGLGLYFVRMAIEAHGGTIEASSILGSGTKIKFTLPK